MTLLDVVVSMALGFAAAAAVGAIAAGMLRRRAARFTDELRRARERELALGQISDVWRWQTDAEHRLVALHAPGAGPGSAVGNVTTAPFWASFAGPGSTRLQAGMTAATALDDIDVDPAPDAWPGAKASFRLRGRPLHDAAGDFCGYVGTLREATAVAATSAPAATPVSAPAAVGVSIGPAPDASPGAASEADHEALGTLVSHDLRAPIRIVEGFTRIVKEDYANVLDGVGHDHLDRVLGAAGRMNHMIDALLALSRLAAQPIARVPVDLSQLAAYVVEDLRRLHPAHAVEVEIEPGMTALGDPTLLRMVLENLLGNAWKYTGNTGHAQVAFVHDRGQPASYVVRDNGAGFDMRYTDRLFGVFQRLHSASEFPGTGVGLASVRRIVRRHGGEIRAEGVPEHGASFYFSLPSGTAVA